MEQTDLGYVKQVKVWAQKMRRRDESKKPEFGLGLFDGWAYYSPS